MKKGHPYSNLTGWSWFGWCLECFGSGLEAPTPFGGFNITSLANLGLRASGLELGPRLAARAACRALAAAGRRVRGLAEPHAAPG